MPLILYGCVAPLVVALVVWMRVAHRIGGHVAEQSMRSLAPDGADRARPAAITSASRWEGLTEEIARRDTRRPLRRSDAALRQRHLAAVLPADARR